MEHVYNNAQPRLGRGLHLQKRPTTAWPWFAFATTLNHGLAVAIAFDRKTKSVMTAALAEVLVLAYFRALKIEEHMNYTEEEYKEWEREFDAAARRSFRERMRYAFVHTCKPVLDDAPYRSFDTMTQYRQWCKENLPEYLGYGD